MLAATLLAAASPAAADPVVAAAGDIACGTGSGGLCAQQRTSDVVAALNPDAVIPLGDNQYENGTLSDFDAYYGPTWGRFKAITHPALGNHEYGTPGAAGYFDYFNGVGSASGAAGARDRGYYSWDIGSWHVIALNSNCGALGGCGPGSPQEAWLRADLAAHPASCTLAYMHHPRWSSDVVVGSDTSVSALVQDLYDYRADLMLAGHAHTYERFAAQDPAGNVDAANGVVEIIAGTGGKSEFAFGTALLPGSLTHADTLGVLKLTLHPSSYDWQFLPAPGETFTDSGTASCHGRTAPGAVTSAASGVTRNSATLNGTVTPNGPLTSYRFEYGATTAYGRSTPTGTVPGTNGATAVRASLSGLARATTYHFRLVATWANGATSQGADVAFTTPRH